MIRITTTNKVNGWVITNIDGNTVLVESDVLNAYQECQKPIKQ